MFDFATLQPKTTPAVLAAVAAADPHREFVIAEDGQATYGEMSKRCTALAEHLMALGLQPGERIGLLLPNGVRWCTALFAAHAAGLAVVPMNTWYKQDELEDVVLRARLRLVIGQAHVHGQNFADVFAGITSRAPADFLGLSVWASDAAAPNGLTSLTAADPQALLRNAPVTESSEALLLFTSGSSATPKTVSLTQGGLVTNAHAVGERQGVVATDRFWFASPLFFVFGCANALPNALTHGATICIQESFDASTALAFIEQQRCTVYYGVAPITRGLAACPDLEWRDISSLRTGTANATADDLRLAIEVLGVEQVCNAYGMTEGYGHSTITAWSDPPEVRMTTQGRALPTQQVRVVRTDGTLTGPDEQGDIQIRGTITPGYYEMPELNESAFASDGWFRTGDIGYLDVDQRLHYVGRSHEMMKVKGINISPAEVEALLVQHPLVEEAFVFGLPTSEGDQKIGCAVVSTVGLERYDELIADVRSWAKDRVASYKVPQQISVVRADQLPLTATGKVSKRLLREQLLT